MVESADFQKLARIVRKCISSRGISEKVNPKLDKTNEILEEHMRRYSSGGVSTRAIVFVATRAHVQEVLSQLDGVPGVLLLIYRLSGKLSTFTKLFKIAHTW